MFRSISWIASAVCASVLSGSVNFVAAQPPSISASERVDSADDSGRWFTRRDALVASAFALGTAALVPFDSRIAKQFQNPNIQSSRALGRTAESFELVASPGSYWIGGTMYAFGMAMKKPRLADLGLHGTEAILVATVAHHLLKGTAGRARPYVSQDANPGDFRLFRGFGSSDYRAFPSGHASTAFAAASAVTAEVSRWRPRATPYVGALMYGGAAMVALSRMYSDKHWASDVVLGAAVGTFSGWRVVQFHHRRAAKVHRAALPASIVPDGAGGVAIAWMIPTTY